MIEQRGPLFPPSLLAFNITASLLIDVLVTVARVIEHGGGWRWASVAINLILAFVSARWVWRMARKAEVQ